MKKERIISKKFQLKKTAIHSLQRSDMNTVMGGERDVTTKPTSKSNSRYDWTETAIDNETGGGIETNCTGR